MLRANLDFSHTIFALASGSLPSAVAILKVSGNRSFEIVTKIFLKKDKASSVQRKRGIWFGNLIDLAGQAFDEVLVITFPGPYSFDGEDTVEIHCHGSKGIVEKAQTLLKQLGARPASPGEFTYRALLNKRKSPVEIGLLADAYRAQTETDLDRLVLDREISLESIVQKLRAELINLQAVFDTAIDFSEEYAAVVGLATRILDRAQDECSMAIHRYSLVKSTVSIQRVVIAGRANVGKSSLFNALLGRKRAIVDELPGTTRDVVEEDIRLNNQPVKLVDTAGFRNSDTGVETLGIEYGRRFLECASIWILVVDGSVGFTPEEVELLETFNQTPHLVVWNKADLPSYPDSLEIKARLGAIAVSTVTGEGLGLVIDRLQELAGNVKLGAVTESVLSRSADKVDKLSRKIEELKTMVSSNMAPEVLSEENRRTIQFLYSLIGQVTTEDVLDRVFSEFCIGK